MAKVFEFDARKGSYIDQVSGEAGTNNNGKFVRSDKGLAWEGNGEDSYITMPSSITISNNYSIEWWDQLYNEDYLGVLGLSSSLSTSYIRHGKGTDENYSNILI